MIDFRFALASKKYCSANCRSRIVLLLALFFTTLISLNAQNAESENPSAADLERSAADLSVLWDKAALQSAIEKYQQSALKRTKVGDFSQASSDLLDAGRLFLILGENDSALKVFRESGRIAGAQKLNAEKSKAESSLALVFQKTGNLVKSKNHLDNAQALNLLTDDKSARALFFFASAEYLSLQRQNQAALNDYEHSLELWQELGEQRRYGEVCIYTAYAFFAEGNLTQALESTNQAEKTLTEIGNRRGIALSQIAAGHILSSSNQKQAALDSYSKAGKNFPADLDLLEKGALLNGIGAIYEFYQDFESSLNNRLQALKVFRDDSYLDGQLATMHSIIGLCFQLKRTADAERYIREAEQLSKILNDKYYITLIYRVIGDNYFELEQYDKAKSFYFRALSNRSGLGAQTNYVLIHHKLGRIYFYSGNTKLAEKHLTMSLAESLRLKNYFVQAENYYYLAQLAEKLNNQEKSLEFVQKSIEISDLLNSDVLNNKLKQTFFSSIYERYTFYIKSLMRDQNHRFAGAASIKALQTAEKSRSRSMLENLSLSDADLTKDGDAETIKREQEIRVSLNADADKLTDLLSNDAAESETGKLDGEINELNVELENIKAKLKQNSPIYSSIKNPAPFDVAEFQRNILDENSLLLEFSFGQDESYLWLVGKNSVESFVLPPREQIETRIEKLRTLIESRGQTEGETIEDHQARLAAADGEFTAESKALSRDLFGQIADKISGKRLIVVPDGKLHYFPISALPLPNSDSGEPILLTNETVYEPSAATLSMLTQIKRKNSGATKNLLVFSDPIFSADDSRIIGNTAQTPGETAAGRADNFRFAESLTSLMRLNGSKAEADSIVEIVGASGAQMLTGAQATRENALDAKTGDYKIIHFATHGLIKEDRPELSGIVLSQFDASGSSQNGVVRLQDIYAMNLNADLVVLSACSTGIGKEVKGEGLMSLNNAFLQSGAKTVVSSLWEVDDEATRELMKNFYGEMAAGDTPTPESLRRAQIKLRHNPQFQSPFYWAAFTAQGDFQNAPKISGGFRWRLYGLPMIGLLLGGIYAFRRRLFDRKIVGEG